LENELFITEADLEVRQTAAYQNSDYLLRKTKFKATFALPHRCSTYLKSTSTAFCLKIQATRYLENILFFLIIHSISGCIV